MQSPAGDNSGAPPTKRAKPEMYGPPQYSAQYSAPQYGGPSAMGGANGHFSLEQFLKRDDEKLPPNHIIRISITNVQYPINVETVYKVCSMAGGVRKIVCFERNNIAQAMVEFDTLESADKARTSLHGCDVYDNCCTMKVEYSKMDQLSVKENGPLSWDFTDKNSEPIDRRPVILNRPGGAMSSMGGSNRGGNMYGSNGGGFSMENMGTTNPMMGSTGNGATNMMNMMSGGADRTSMGHHGHHDMMPGAVDQSYGEDRTSVLMAYGLDSEKWDPSLVFNLVCQYGNVNKIFFMKNKDGTAMVEMGDPIAADNVHRFVGEIAVFNNKVRFSHSKKHKRLDVMPLEYELPNGSSSIKSYMHEKHLNRFLRHDMARKNRLLRPTKVLHFYNVERVPDEELNAGFQLREAPFPINIKWMEPKENTRSTGVSGLLYFETVEDATDALVLMNHAQVGERNMKLVFSPAKY